MTTTKVRRRTHLYVIAALLIGAVALVFGKYEFSLTEPQIAQKIEAVLPIETNGVSIDTITVDLSQSDNTVLLRAQGTATRLARTYQFEIQAEGVPEYRFISGEFFFRPESVEIVRLEQTEGESVEESVSRVTGVLKELFPQRAEVIDEATYAAIRVAPEIQRWFEARAESAAVYVLARAPIYTLPRDATGFAAQAVLDDIQIVDETLVVSLSLYRLGTWVIVFFLGALIVLAHMLWPFALATNGSRR